MINLYHGSNVSIEQINLNMGHKGEDFGKGFQPTFQYYFGTEHAIQYLKKI